MAFVCASIALARCQDLGSEALAAGRNILTDMTDPDAKFRDVVRRNVRDSAHRVLKRLSGQGRKRKRVKAQNNLRELRRGRSI